MSRLIRFVFLYFAGATLLISCAGNRHLRYANEGEPSSVPRYLELAEEQSISTVHFPAGLYSLDLVDDDGYYYRARGQVVKHSFAGPAPQDAGIFVSKQNRRMRGYIVWAGGRTKIGNLSHARITFRD
jgi:hypothetical protein